MIHTGGIEKDCIEDRVIGEGERRKRHLILFQERLINYTNKHQGI